MIDPAASLPAAMVRPVVRSAPAAARGTEPQGAGESGSAAQEGRPKPAGPDPAAAEPILCGHCGRTASNGISCQGMCVADSGY